MNYQLLTRALAAVGAGLLVDPYFKPRHLDWLMDSTSIARVLVGDKGSQKPSNKELPFVLGRRKETSALPVEVRISDASSLHDRVIVHQDGSVSMLGSSLTGVSQHLTAIIPMPAEAAQAYREHVERLWAEATRVEPRDGIDGLPGEAPDAGPGPNPTESG